MRRQVRRITLHTAKARRGAWSLDSLQVSFDASPATTRGIQDEVSAPACMRRVRRCGLRVFLEHSTLVVDVMTIGQMFELSRSLHEVREPRLAVDSGNAYFGCYTQDGIAFLSVADKAFPRDNMFGYLEELAQAFVKYLEDQHGKNWSSEVARVGRPYPYIHFEPVIRQRRRQALDPERKAGASRLQERMSEIHGVMSRNINDILDRGEKLDDVSRASSRLVQQSKSMHWGAKRLRWLDWLRRMGPLAFAVLVIVLVIYWRFF